ncbi:hypothetical protein M9H77_08873 [Catharanthus roseus]|uniref:Uncharacterized protein n=1 Tax=Catharanthus roseus TaxID=4058 RepID=A0ACC0BZF6_CATRO|nr:hypothetical protein M9H77_08873 [Catharanthus roseus]
MFSTICYMFIRNSSILGALLMAWTISDSGEWIHLKRGVVLWRVWPNRSTYNTASCSAEGFETKVGPRADLSGCYGNRALVWYLTGIDYEKLELSSDDLVMLWDPDFIRGARLLHYILTQGGQRYSKPLKLGVEFLVRVSPKGHVVVLLFWNLSFSVERHADTLFSLFIIYILFFY